MKSNKIIYWLATGAIVLLMTLTSYSYLTKAPQIMQSIKELGIPYYFMFMLGIAKILGILALLFSKRHKLKEWAYAGFTFTFIGAMWAHYSVHTSIVAALISLILLGLSYWQWHKLDSIQNSNTSGVSVLS